MPSLFSMSPKAFLACIHISYDKPPPSLPSAVLFSLRSRSSVTLNGYLDYLNIFVYMVNICLLMPVLYGTKSIWNKERTVSISKLVCKTKHAFVSRQRVLMLITILHCICWNVPKNILIVICLHPPPSHTPPLATAPCCFHSAAGQMLRLRRKYRADHGSCRSENQNTSVILPRRWSSYVIWFVLHIRVEV